MIEEEDRSSLDDEEEAGGKVGLIHITRFVAYIIAYIFLFFYFLFPCGFHLTACESEDGTSPE